MPEPESSKAHGPSRTRGMPQIGAGASLHDRQRMLPAEKFIPKETRSSALLLVCAIVALGGFAFLLPVNREQQRSSRIRNQA